MFDADTVRFLESGCGLIVGAIRDGNEPFATRGWGLTVLRTDGTLLRLLLDAADVAGVEAFAATEAIAVTGADVRTLRSVQVKGHILEALPATSEDRARVREYCDEFFTSVTETDGISRDLLERLRPIRFIACAFATDEVYDQTPGPKAGSQLPPARPRSAAP